MFYSENKAVLRTASIVFFFTCLIRNILEIFFPGGSSCQANILIFPAVLMFKSVFVAFCLNDSQFVLCFEARSIFLLYLDYR